MDYQQLLDEIIQAIREDDTANSDTVNALIARLQELQAAGAAQLLDRKIIAGNGLIGGGDLTADRTLSLASGALSSLSKADSAVQPAALTTALAAYLTTATAANTYAKKSEVEKTFTLPFTHPGTVNGNVLSPVIVLPRSCVLTDITATVQESQGNVRIEMLGGLSGNIQINAGSTQAVKNGLSLSVSAPIQLRIVSSSATMVTAVLRFREV